MEITPKKIPDFLSGGGEMGERIRNFDWASTPLGVPENWEQSLKTCVRIMLASSQPIWIGWGRQLIKLYNDPYKTIVGGKHPWALGEPASVVWSDIWRDIEPMLRRVMENDEGTYVESQLLIMERNDYPEETYYTFSYTPIPGDKGGTGGMICANTDDTARILNERALETLRDLGKLSLTQKNLRGIYTGATAILAKNNKDFPSASIYEINEHDMLAKAVAWAGDANTFAVFPQLIDIQNPVEGTGNICRAIVNNEIVLSDNAGRRLTAPKGGWDIPPKQFLHIPLRISSDKLPGAVISIGLNPYRKYDNTYQQFMQLMADQLSLEINNLRALEEERRRSEALAEIDKAKTVFFNNISHEFRTPLTLMLGPLEELLRQPSNTISDKNLESITTTHRNAMRLLKLVNTLLDFSRIESGRQMANYSAVDIASFTKSLAATFRSVIEQAGLQLIVHADKIEQPVFVDKQMWEKIVFNLLSNAFKYTLSGSIRVQLFSENNTVVLQVADTGVGIPAKELPRMFERFHRVQGTAGRTFEGTGIGLSMIKELVHLHGGSISVASEEGTGSTFTIKIPTGKDHLSGKQISLQNAELEDQVYNAYVDEAASFLKTSEETNKHLQPLENVVNASRTPSIIVVDDNADMLEYISGLLAKDYHVVTAVNGAEALKKIHDHQPAIVVSDIMMPVMDGITMLKELKSDVRTSRLPVILLSARAGEEAKIEGYDIGADDYIVKPFSAKELLARVRSQLKITSARQHAEQQLKNLFLQAPVALCIFRGPQFVVEVANEKMLELWGKQPSQVINKPVFEGMPDIVGQGFEELLENVYTTGERFVAPEMGLDILRNGVLERIYVKFVYEALHEEDGTISGIMALADEITEQVINRKKIEESEQQLRIAIEGGELGMFDYDATTGTLNWSEKTKEFFGLAPGDETSLEIYLNALHPDDRARSKALSQGNIDRTNTDGDLYELEYRVTGVNDGKLRWLRSKGIVTYNEQGKAVRFTGIIQDITQRKLWEQTLTESEERFRTLAETLPLLIWQTDEKGNAEFASRRWKEYTGIEPVDESSWRAIVHPDDLDKINYEWQHSLQSNANYSLNARIKSKTGEYRWHAVSGEPVFNSEKQVVKWVGSLTDIHAERTFSTELEKQVDNRTRELKQSRQTLEEKNSQLEKVNKELEAFAYISSHDLQEPLRKIQIFTTRILDMEKNLSIAGQDYFNRILNAAERMKQLILDLLSFSRVRNDAGRFEKCNLSDIMADVQTELREVIDDKHAIIELKNMNTVRIIPFQFKQLMLNLVTNALKFSRRDIAPRIIIDSELAETKMFPGLKLPAGEVYCHISVEDNGIGFEPQFKEQIFELFQRLHTREEYEGTGIGLAIVKKIADNHHGIITATGDVDKGARFDIYIPAPE